MASFEFYIVYFNWSTLRLSRGEKVDVKQVLGLGLGKFKLKESKHSSIVLGGST